MNYLITGGSRGLGNALARDLPSAADTAYLISRNTPTSLELRDGITRHWLETDFNHEGVAQQVLERVGSVVLDVVIHNAGIWERGAFSDQYSFESVTDAETRAILRVNLESVITVARVA